LEALKKSAKILEIISYTHHRQKGNTIMRTLIAVLAFLLSATSSFIAKAAPALNSAEFTTVQHPVVKGESLLQIASDFGVTIDLILSPTFNPVLAKRNNPDLIYAGETITIPLPLPQASESTETKEPAAVRAQTSVSNSSQPIQPALAAETTMKGTSEAGTSSFLFWGSSMLAGLSVFFLSWGLHFYMRKPAAEAKERTTVQQESIATQKGASFHDMTPEELIEALGNVKARTLVQAMKMTIADDERRNQVLLGNVVQFVQHEKRSWPNDVLVKDLSRTLQVKETPITRIKHERRERRLAAA